MNPVRLAFSVAISAALAVASVPVMATPLRQPRPVLLPVTADLLPLIRVQSCEVDCGPTEPPVDPPIDPPVEPPTEPPVDPETPVDPPVGPPNEAPQAGITFRSTDRDPPALSAAGTARIEWLIADRIRHCEAYRPIWRVDCLADGFKQIARSLPVGDGYSEVRESLSATADDLAAIARRNADPAKPPERLTAQTSAGPRRTSRPIVAIAPERLAAASAQADSVVTDLATTLLRSSPNADGNSDIARIAAAVDSTRVLLRSS